MDLLLYFLDQRAVRRITKSSFWLTRQSLRVYPIVYPHHLPLKLWHMLWGDMEVCCPDLPSRTLRSCWLCCQWATLSHQPLWGQHVCNDPSRWRHKVLASGHFRTTMKGHLHSRPPWDQLRSSGQCSSLILPSALPCPIPPDSIVLVPRAALIHIPALNSWVCIPENQPATPIRKHSSTQGGSLFENYWLYTYL